MLLALARRPELLILDEPTTGLDPVARQDVLSELLAALQEEKKSVFFSSHHTHDVEQICDRVTFIDEGRILESDETATFLDHWRRLSIEINSGGDIRLPDGCRWTSRQGQRGVIVTGHFSDDLVQQLTSAGTEVSEVERMTLEEIFTTRVGISRERRAS